MAVIDAPPQTTWQQDLLASARRVSAGVVGGLATGALIGGVGGRLAMFVLRVTSDPSLHGLKTDDGFTIGRFSGETLFLVLATAALGVLGGLLYLAVRPWLPERWRAALAGHVRRDRRRRRVHPSPAASTSRSSIRSRSRS